MAERLAKLVRDATPMENPYANDARIEMLREALKTATDPRGWVALRPLLADDLMSAGRNVEAAKSYGSIAAEAKARSVILEPGALSDLRMLEAVAWLRLGEQVNCRSNHSAQACLLPIHGQGVHRAREGSEKARELLLEQLRVQPGDSAARWLLNVAAMTLGEYPDGVAEGQRISPKVFASEFDLPRFPDVATSLGVVMDDLAGGTIVEDFDGDHLLDILFSSWKWEGQLRYFRNLGTGRFQELTTEAGLIGLTGGLNMIQGDFNNDGHPDVFILRGAWLGAAGRHPNSLLRNNGDGTFTDVTEQAGVLSFHPTQTAVWLDVDNDGWLDLFVGNETTRGATIGLSGSDAQTHPCELFRNNHDGTFTECASACGLDVRAFVKGVTSDDYNHDGRPDLYLSCLGEPNRLLRNDGPVATNDARRFAWRFTDVAASAGVTEPILSFPTWFFDYDNDGWPDIFVTGYTTSFGLATTRGIVDDFLGLPNKIERPRLYRNMGDGTFSNVTAAMKLDHVLYAMGANFGDIDADGWLDMYVGTGDPNLGNLIPNVMLRNDGGKRFQNVTTATDTGHLQKGHGIGFGDLNNDGFSEVVANLGGAYLGDNYHKAIFANPGNNHHWIALKLAGVKSNRSAIGATVRVVVESSSGRHAFYRTVNSGGSFGASTLRQEIGLGAATRLVSVEVRWPGAASFQRLSGLELDQFHLVREGEERVTRIQRKTFKLPESSAAPSHPHKHS